jgi:hypothetical protein
MLVQKYKEQKQNLSETDGNTSYVELSEVLLYIMNYVQHQFSHPVFLETFLPSLKLRRWCEEY